MRRILLALTALAFMAPAAEAARRDERGREAPGRQVQQQVSQPGKAQSAARAGTAQARPAPGAARTAAQPVRRSTLQAGDVRTSRTGLVVRGAAAATVSRDAMASCVRRNGRTICGGGRDTVVGWQAGLPSVNYAQRECPEGTFATLARGHEDVVRCMPF